MRCPRCSFEGELVEGACSNCGYRRVSEAGSLRNSSVTGIRPSSNLLGEPSGVVNGQSMPMRALSGSQRSPSMSLRSVSNPSRPLSLAAAKSGDLLKQGRYRLIDQLVLPDNQQDQGAAWLASDTSAIQTQVIIREILVSGGESQEEMKQRVRAAALRLSEVARHPGFPRVLDVFSEQGRAFIVLQHIEGESLASLLRRQGGALPERTVVEYGQQLCDMLVTLGRQEPPIIHGAISPETVIINPDRTCVHLLHLPLFAPREIPHNGSAPGYKAPEQARGMADQAADLYAVAATLHHAVTGFDPRERAAFFYPPARRLNPAVSQQMETILVQELRLSALQRYASATDMQKDLVALLEHTGSEPEKRIFSLVAARDPLNLDISEIRKRSRQRNFMQLGIFASISLVIVLCVVFLLGVYPLLKSGGNLSTQPTANPTATMIAQIGALDAAWQNEATSYKKNQVALSDGRYAFDTYAGRFSQELPYKTRAAQAVLKNQLGSAFSDYEKAVTLDTTDGEAQIYCEDLKLEMQNIPYVTIVLGVPLDGGPSNLSFTRLDLEAAFVFQHQVNTQNLLPHGLKLRILIGNSGKQDSGATTIAQFITARVQAGNLDHIIAVVGWPTTAESSSASAVLTAAKIPMVAQTASGVLLDNLSPYFFRVNPDDTAQGQLQGKFAYQQLGARTALVLRDPTDAYSKSLADAFISSFKQQGGSVIDNQADYFTEQTTTVAQYEQNAVRDALHNRADLIFMPGYDQDAIRLAHALGRMASIYPYYLNNVKILGGDAVDTPMVLGNGIGNDSVLALQYPRDMRRLRFTSFSDASEWNNIAHQQQPAFFAAWQSAYGGGTANAPSITNDALMTDDAFGVIVYAIKQVKGSLTGASVRAALASLGSKNIPPYQGVSGPILFGSDGDPLDKPIVLLEVAYNSTTGGNLIQLVQTSGKIN